MAKLATITSIGRAAIRLLMVAAAGMTFVFIARALAGKQTFADLEVKLLAELYTNRWTALILSWTLTGAAGSWAIGERRLRKRHIERNASETSILQMMIDSKRRSSQLMANGTTRPEDE